MSKKNKDFKDMTDRESVNYQLDEWVNGNPLHNTLRDECCPDFSCCNGGDIMPDNLRARFKKAHNDDDDSTKWEIMSMGLSMIFSDIDQSVYIAGEDPQEH